MRLHREMGSREPKEKAMDIKHRVDRLAELRAQINELKEEALRLSAMPAQQQKAA